jgi:hypothetical protein
MNITIKEIERLVGRDGLYLFLDIDGVLFKSCLACTQLLNERFNMNVKPQDI